MPSILPVKQTLSEGVHLGWVTVKTNNPKVIHLSPGKETTRGREALQLFFPPNGTLMALKWTSTQLCGSGKAQGLDGPYIVNVSQFPKPFLFIWKDSICKTFIQGLIANKSLHGATPLKDYTMAWPDNQCPIHALISRDKMDVGELAHRLQEPLSLSL